MREDLELRDEAKKLGWQESFHVIDKQTKQFDCPQFPITFIKGDKTIWKCASSQWACADLDSPPNSMTYVRHRYYETLKEALAKENKILN